MQNEFKFKQPGKPRSVHVRTARSYCKRTYVRQLRRLLEDGKYHGAIQFTTDWTEAQIISWKAYYAITQWIDRLQNGPPKLWNASYTEYQTMDGASIIN